MKGFLLMDLDEIFRKASLLYSLTLTPSKKLSGMSIPSQTPRRDLDYRLSLDGVSIVGS
jgi:hypothetical protein